MKTLKPWLLLALVFGVGVILGVAGTRLVVRRTVREALLHPAQVQTSIERRLVRRLRLDAAQAGKLDEILTGARGQLMELRKQYRPPVTLVFSNANVQINALLTPEQRGQYEKIKAENAGYLRGLRGE
jgi:Spy/CpxP family protein refolding chaperone